MDTAWGPSQWSTVISDGIRQHSTASHGGFELSGERHQQLQAMFDFPTFAGGLWYEEDCDVCAVVLAFPECFSESEIHEAYEQAKSMCDEAKWQRVIEHADKSTVITTAVATQRDIKQKLWRRGSASTKGDGWTVFFSRAGETKQLKMPYPEKAYYTDKELEALCK